VVPDETTTLTSNVAIVIYVLLMAGLLFAMIGIFFYRKFKRKHSFTFKENMQLNNLLFLLGGNEMTPMELTDGSY